VAFAPSAAALDARREAAGDAGSSSRSSHTADEAAPPAPERLVGLKSLLRSNWNNQTNISYRTIAEAIALDDLRVARFKDACLAVNLIMTDISDDGGMMEHGMTAAKDFTIPPTSANKEIGEKIYEGLADYLAEFIEEFGRVKLLPIGSVGPLAGL
jgi:hypothetical protein